ncbi:MAG: glycoside hydrolase family 16 protein [Clostridia bacterium]|nr:glycoside hydrolase family 16 protein [Clostridia bacterium]
MEKGFALLLAVLLVTGCLISCGNPADPGTPVSSEKDPGSDAVPEGTGSDTAPDSEPQTESENAPVSRGDPLKEEFEAPYHAPEDGSFTVCGIPLSEYTPILYWSTSTTYSRIGGSSLFKPIVESLTAATGTEFSLKVIRNDKYDENPKADHEILFGVNFRREGIPEANPKKSYYGVTENGTVYFCTPAPRMYFYLWELFLEEFFGVAPGSGERSSGCAISACYREIPTLTDERLEACGYRPVFEDEFGGESLDLDAWEVRGNGPRRGGFNASSQVSVRDGKLVLTGSYLQDGEYGEGWYAGAVSPKQWYRRGYFEATIRANPTGNGNGFWSAFWIQGPDPYTPEVSQGGIGPGGCEIDVMESFFPDYSSSTFWCGGVEGVDGLYMEAHIVLGAENNYQEDFHTYALLWDETYYTLLLDGEMVGRTTYAYGTSTVEEQVILSLELNDEITLDPGETLEMTVESLRIWQQP